MLVFGIFILVFIILVLVLFIPIVFFIDTDRNEYFIQLKGLAKASIEPLKEDVFRVKLTILIFNYYFYPLTYSFSKENPRKNKRIVKIKSNRTHKLFRVLSSFKIKRMLLNIDTGDWTLNAKLYPLFYFLNFGKGDFWINFQGKNQLVLHIQNRPIDIIKSYINFKI